MKQKLKGINPDWFLIGLFSMILLAWLVPGIGSEGSFIPLEEITSYGVSLIFFFYGLSLSRSKLRAGLTNWKLHLTIHSATFLLFPALALIAFPFIRTEEHQLLWLAVFFLAALPSTVSSSVVMVSIAEGNVPAAIFNASISGVIGIIVTPLLMNFFMADGAAGFEFGDVIGQLFLQILMPVFAGVALHRYLGPLAEKHKSKLKTFDKAIILAIVYESFSESFETGIFQEISTAALLVVAVSVIALFFMIYGLIHLISKSLQFNREDRITALFCGSKKSLVHGSVFASVLFSGMAGAGVFLLPVMIYHSFQLFYVSFLAQSMQRKNKKAVNPLIAP